MTTAPGTPVVVGVDGSPQCLLAVSAAVRAALDRKRPLRIVHAFIWPQLGIYTGPSPQGPIDSGLQYEAEGFVTDAVTQARATAATLGGALEITGELVTGSPAAVMVNESRRAALVVLGCRGLGGFTGLLAGSVAVQVTAHAASPVLVVRGDPDRTGEVLVGVDGSAGSEAALGHAFAEAAYRQVGLAALHAYPATDLPGLAPGTGPTAGPVEAGSQLLAEALAGWQEQYPQVPVRRVLVPGRAARALVEASSMARQVVVGCRGRGGFTGLLLGSASQAVLHHAACPVAVVRSPRPAD